MSYVDPWASNMPGFKAPPKSKVVAPVNTDKGTNSSAQAQLTAQMVAWGMPPELGAWAWQTYKGLGVTTIAEALPTIQAEIVNQPAFQARFPAYKTLAAQGEAMTPAQMIAYEDSAKQVFQAAGLPKGFYDQPNDLATFMVNHVSASELQSRVQLAEQASTTAPPDVREQLQTLYGLSPGALTAYYLNPQKALPVIQQQFAGAQIGAEATRTGVGQLTQAQADHLAAIGLTDAGAAQGFNQLGQQQGLFQAQVTGEAPIDLATQLSATFDNSAAAQLRIARAKQQRLADFQGAAGEQLSAAGVGGLGRTDRSSG